MDIKRRICLYGNSVILGAVGTSLRRFSHFEVTTLALIAETQELEALKPDVVIFDLEATHPEAAFSLLDNCPTLLLIGVSPDKNQIQMWAGRQLSDLSTQGLLEVINQQANSSPVP